MSGGGGGEGAAEAGAATICTIYVIHAGALSLYSVCIT